MGGTEGPGKAGTDINLKPPGPRGDASEYCLPPHLITMPGQLSGRQGSYKVIQGLSIPR